MMSRGQLMVKTKSLPKAPLARTGTQVHESHRFDSAGQQGEKNVRQHITCQISADGLVSALAQEDQLQSNLRLDSLYIEHTRIRTGKTDGVWFASAVTAYGTTSQTILWNYKIPDDILAFSRREIVRMRRSRHARCRGHVGDSGVGYQI